MIVGKRLWIAAVSFLLVSGTALAQSKVTLYGVLDEGLDFTTNAGGHSAYQMVSGDSWGSRWGIKGNEDLGGGLAAIFQLESGFDLNSGKMSQGGRLFGRQAYVGLDSSQWGKLTLGRQYDPALEMWGMNFTAAGGSIGDLAAHPFDNDNADYDFRVNNAVKYTTPLYRGLQAEAMYAFSGVAGGFASNRLYGAAVSYATGPLSTAVAYTKTNNGGTNTGGALAGDQVFTAASQQNIDFGLKWTFPNLSNVSFAYSHTAVDSPVANAYVPDLGSESWNSWKFDNFEINGQYYFRPDLSLTGSYTFTRSSLNSAADDFHPSWQQVAFMLEYDLSKRTSLYLQGAYQHVNGKTGTGMDYANIVYSAAPSSSNHQMEYRVAVLHKF
ncbi:porin [Burkholderia cenocepacia]|nr:porin [Burkholderia cenocepacia]